MNMRRQTTASCGEGGARLREMEQQSLRLTSRHPGIRPYSGYTCPPQGGSQAGAGTQGHPRA